MLAKGQGLVKDGTKVMNTVGEGHSGAVSEVVGLERNVFKKWVHDSQLFGQGSSDHVQDELEVAL